MTISKYIHYVTKDGEKFDSFPDAQRHEAWLGWIDGKEFARLCQNEDLNRVSFLTDYHHILKGFWEAGREQGLLEWQRGVQGEASNNAGSGEASPKANGH